MKIPSLPRLLSPSCLLGLLALTVMMAGGSAQAENESTVSGVVSIAGRNVTLQNAYLILSPDIHTAGKLERAVLLSGADLSEALRQCRTIICTREAMSDGLIINLEVPHNKEGHFSWSAHFAGEEPQLTMSPSSALELQVDENQRVSGRILAGDWSGDEPSVSAVFDALLFMEFKDEVIEFSRE